MRSAYKIATAVVLIANTGCSTLNESMQLGATLGAASGAAASHSVYRSVDKNPTFEEVGSGAAIGLAVGLLTSYLVHGQVEEDRATQTANRTEMYFGDLPPNPFVFPTNRSKRGK